MKLRHILKSRHRYWVYLAILVSYMIIIFKPTPSPGGSDNHKLFIRIPFKSMAKGEYVSIDTMHNGIHYPLIKKLAGLPGDKIVLKGENIFINNIFLCQRLGKTSDITINSPFKDEIISPAYLPNVIPDDSYFVYLPHPFSFDSRYLGLIRGSDIDGVMVPLF